MEKYISKSALVAEIEKCYNECLKRVKITDSDYWNAKVDAYRNVLVILNDTLEVKELEEPTSNDLEEAAWTYYDKNKPLIPHELDLHKEMISFFIAGAKWQKEQMIEKMCVFLKSTDFCKYYNKEFVEEFKKAMKE